LQRVERQQVQDAIRHNDEPSGCLALRNRLDKKPVQLLCFLNSGLLATDFSHVTLNQPVDLLAADW